MGDPYILAITIGEKPTVPGRIRRLTSLFLDFF